MLGREYSKNLDILTDSFSQMNKKYRKKKIQQKNYLFKILERFYISFFGIPEIGFQLRGQYLKKIFFKYLQSRKIKSILDAGSGIGSHTFWLAQQIPRAQVVGVDVDKYKIEQCEKLQHELKINNISFQHFDIASSKKLPLKFNFIVSIDVLEHIKNYKQALRNLYLSLHKNGYLFIHVPQPKQKRLFSSMKNWSHEGHKHEGIKKHLLIESLSSLGFSVILTRETYGYFGKLAWEINHKLLASSFFLAGLTFPFLYLLTIIDTYWSISDGLGIIVLAKKI
jgi:2-polyprenyl-3-methyl-5-hydroxy-6-metoxy-1,4-benzoquinol methylase